MVVANGKGGDGRERAGGGGWRRRRRWWWQRRMVVSGRWRARIVVRKVVRSPRAPRRRQQGVVRSLERASVSAGGFASRGSFPWNGRPDPRAARAAAARGQTPGTPPDWIAPRLQTTLRGWWASWRSTLVISGTFSSCTTWLHCPTWRSYRPQRRAPGD